MLKFLVKPSWSQKPQDRKYSQAAELKNCWHYIKDDTELFARIVVTYYLYHE